MNFREAIKKADLILEGHKSKVHCKPLSAKDRLVFERVRANRMY
jgi:hypothetical protein